MSITRRVFIKICLATGAYCSFPTLYGCGGSSSPDNEHHFASGNFSLEQAQLKAVDWQGNRYFTDAAGTTLFGEDQDDNRLFTIAPDFEIGYPDNPGDLLAPADVICIDSCLYVLDKHSGYVNCYNQQGEFLSRFAGRGFESGQLTHPGKMVYQDETFYLLDKGKNEIAVFSPEGDLLKEIWLEIDEKIEHPHFRSFAIDSKNQFHVVDEHNGTIDFYSADGLLKQQYAVDSITEPSLRPHDLQAKHICAGLGDFIYLVSGADSGFIHVFKEGTYITSERIADHLTNVESDLLPPWNIRQLFFDEAGETLYLTYR